ncbi:unnamed protein product [Rhizophagus irregularis]|nr:unnamed protein product [Rhizophagus irregularis]
MITRTGNLKESPGSPYLSGYHTTKDHQPGAEYGRESNPYLIPIPSVQEHTDTYLAQLTPRSKASYTPSGIVLTSDHQDKTPPQRYASSKH